MNCPPVLCVTPNCTSDTTLADPGRKVLLLSWSPDITGMALHLLYCWYAV